MKQKTMRFEDDVLFALKAMTWREDGRLGVLTAQLGLISASSWYPGLSHKEE